MPDAPTTPPLPAGHNLRAAAFWWGFNMRRNLRKRSFYLWGAAVVAVFCILKFGARLRPDELGDAFVLGLPPLLALFFGSGVLREEIEDQTLTYPFSRPVGRAYLYGARVLAAAVPVALLTVPFAFLAGTGTGPKAAAAYTTASALAAAAYTCFFALAGQLIKWPTWFGLAFLLFWEAIVGMVPGFLGRLTLSTHVRAVAHLAPRGGHLSKLWEAPPTTVSMITLLGIVAVTLWLAGERVRRKEFVLTR